MPKSNNQRQRECTQRKRLSFKQVTLTLPKDAAVNVSYELEKFISQQGSNLTKEGKELLKEQVKLLRKH